MSDWPRIPPEYATKRWPQQSPDGEILSRFPPHGTDAFYDFQRYSGALARAEHPEWLCAKCGRDLEKPSIDAGRAWCRWCRAGQPKYEPSAKANVAATDEPEDDCQAVELPGLAR